MAINKIFQDSLKKFLFSLFSKITEIRKNIDETKGAEASVKTPILKKFSVFIFFVIFSELII